jgi:serine/threonine-protein kinase
MSKTDQDNAQPLAAGDWVLDRYIIESKIAVGGHSVVYRGIDERLSRPVCVKAFHKLASDKGIWKTAYEHFVQEAFALSKLSHPNTLRIYDFGQIESAKGNFPVQVSEFMAGGTLAHLVSRGGVMSLPDVVDSICKLADALAEAHRLDIIHRDIKPQNILYTIPGPEREPKLADFGIAKSITADNVDNQAEKTEVVVGFPLAMFSPSWGAPEQLCGADATPAIDIYSLGLVTVFALTGRAICKSTSAQEGYDKRRHSNDLVADVLDGVTVPPAVVSFLQRACAFEPEDRPETALDFADEFREAFHARRNRLNSSPGLFQDESEKTAAPARANLKAQGTDSTPEVAVPTPSPEVQAAAPEREPSDSTPRPVVHTVNTGATITLHNSPPLQRVGPRSCQFVEFVGDAVSFKVGNSKLKVMYTPAPNSKFGRTLTVRGLSCFVSKVDGRPSSAVHLEQNDYLEIMDPRQKKLGRIYVSFGHTHGGATQFRLADNSVSLMSSECRLPILIDSPSHQQSFFLYVPQAQDHMTTRYNQ